MHSFVKSSSIGGLRLRKNATKGPNNVAGSGSYVRLEHKHGVIKNDGNGVTMRVKVLMTKDEAATLLSKCSGEGTLGFEDVAMELKQIPINRVSVVGSNNHCDNSMFS
ncbi:hypothetical protein QVD17_13533 [Tagetes erecta]|uniref:DUF7890 domain-containing protein n=1 Tax=Tagetes erecta TaxID=13708 RepID=A0AAD8KWV1_TARER|nr:hypothetical protein QVD17_13533 [Tagetes erecta]